MATQAGLEAVEAEPSLIAELGPIDVPSRPGDRYQSYSGCITGDLDLDFDHCLVTPEGSLVAPDQRERTLGALLEGADDAEGDWYARTQGSHEADEALSIEGLEQLIRS